MIFWRNDMIGIPYIKSPATLWQRACMISLVITALPGLAQASDSAPAPWPVQIFDQSRVDRVLYPHQSVGVPYTISGQRYYPVHDPGYNRAGVASWYGDKFHGRRTANGEIYNKHAMTAAHKTLPLNSYVIVTNLDTNYALRLRINDRGPFAGNRIIDLSEAAAVRLGLKKTGLGLVSVQYAGPAPRGRAGPGHRKPTPAPRIKPETGPGGNPRSVNP